VAEILAGISSLQTPEELEELTDGLLAIRASRVAPVLSGEETRLQLAINAGVSAELRDRIAALIEKRNNLGLSTGGSHELTQLGDKVERRGMERLEALSRLAELRGVSLRELMKSLGIISDNHG
jgi:hypothetical protein